jgi:uncharacterized protein (DUF305 family)
MKKQSIIVGVTSLLIGVLLTGFTAAYAVNNKNTGLMQTMGMQTSQEKSGGSMTMNDMSAMLQGKTGDDFDKAFLSGMIEHHQGAIDMAKLAQKNAKHDEIKKMANDIITAQSNEIDMMQTWQTEWGYNNTPTSHDMMSH